VHSVTKTKDLQQLTTSRWHKKQCSTSSAAAHRPNMATYSADIVTVQCLMACECASQQQEHSIILHQRCPGVGSHRSHCFLFSATNCEVTYTGIINKP